MQTMTVLTMLMTLTIVNDLDNAGDFMPILVKTHQSGTNAYFRLEFDETKIKVWTEDSSAMITRTNSYIPNGNLIQAYHNYSYSDLFSEGAERELYVQALESGEHSVDVTYVLDGEDLWNESLSVTFVKIDFVRMYDINKTANRTTRAVDATLRNARTYEDNERSDSEIDNNNPLLVAGGYGVNMDVVEIALQCQFAPASLGEHILWDIECYKDCGYSCLANKDFRTGTLQNISLFTSEQENRARTAGQYDKDFKIVVGLDQNKDGILSNDEKFDMDFNIRTIGKEEYEYCRGQFNDFLINLAWPLFPDMANFIDIFLDTDLISSYDWVLSDTVPFSGNYDQRNSLGCDQLSYTLGSCRHYYWDEASGISQRIKESNDFWDDVISKAILEANIEAWYADPANSSVTSQVFYVSLSDKPVEFDSSTNLKNSLGKATACLSINIYTVRSVGTPKIIGFYFAGEVIDLYDFRTHVSDENNGYASRTQLCYETQSRSAGKIYEVTVDFEQTFVCPYAIACTDLSSLWSEYLFYITN